MSDNTTLPGTGDVVRDIDHGGVKTQVVALDFGGEAGPEQLVSNTNPLPVGVVPSSVQAFSGGIPVDDANLNAAQTSDQPLFTAITGDPAGDFAGINILEKLVDDSGDLKMAVRVVNPPKQDTSGAQIASDAPAPIVISGPIGTSVTFDTQGYQSAAIHTLTSTGGTLTVSNDGVNFVLATIICSITTGGAAFGSTWGQGNGTYIFPCLFRYARIALTVAGTAIVQLRNIPCPISFNSNNPGTSIVGGPNAVAVAPTGSPVMISGNDSGTPGLLAGVPVVRRILTDNTGRLRLAEETSALTSTGGVSMAVQDTTQFEGQSQVDLLSQLLLEMKVMNQQIYALLILQNANGLVAIDEPASLRLDQTIFNS